MEETTHSSIHSLKTPNTLDPHVTERAGRITNDSTIGNTNHGSGKSATYNDDDASNDDSTLASIQASIAAITGQAATAIEGNTQAKIDTKLDTKLDFQHKIDAKDDQSSPPNSHLRNPKNNFCLDAIAIKKHKGHQGKWYRTSDVL